MKKIKNIVLSLIMALLVAGLLAPQAFAAEAPTAPIVNYQDLVNGVAVMDDGIIYAVAGSSIKGFNASGTNVYTASLPAKCGNLCAYGSYLFAAGYMSGHMNEIYVLQPGQGSSCKTLDAGQRAQAVAVDYDGYLYCVNSTGTRSNGKKATKILRAKISDVVSLSSGGSITWTEEFQPNYTPPATDGNCYPQGIAVDGKGNIYIADKGASNGYDGSVDGIYKYDPADGSVSAMYFTAGSSHRLFTWVYDVSADDYGTVAVVGRNNYEVAVFGPGSTSADAIIKAKGYPEGVGMDKEGNVYFNASNHSEQANNGIYRIDMGHVAVTDVSLSVDSKSIYEGKNFTLSATVSPSDATNKEVLFSSSNTAVATVDASGKVTGKKKGTATITAKTVQGRKTASCQVTVNEEPQPETPQSGQSGGKQGDPQSGQSGDQQGTTQTGAKPAAQSITASNITKTYGSAAFNLGAKTSGNGKLTYKSDNTKVAVVSSAGLITIKGAGTAKITIRAAATSKYKAASKTITVTINKAANPLTVKAKAPAVKYKKLKKKNQTIAAKKAVTVKNAQGTVTYKKAKGSKKITVDPKTGKIMIKKGLKKGTYKVKIKVKAAGNDNYKSGSKTVTVKVKVK